MVYWATMRMRALVLPRTKSTDTACLPSNAATSLARDLTAGPMFTVWRSSGLMKSTEAWASCSSNWVSYGRRTAMNL
ncbi:hypothetical protein D9M73_213040 [compost metagenome]